MLIGNLNYKELQLDNKNNFDLEIVELASKNAAAVALQGGAVDMIVTDWFWVSRQRNEGRNFSLSLTQWQQEDSLFITSPE